LAVFANFLFTSILLCSIGFIGYLVYEQDKAVAVLFEQQNEFTRQRNDNFNSNVVRIDSLQNDIQQLQSDLAGARQEATALIEEQATAIARLQNELVSTRLRINSTSPGASQEWLLAEAASLLRLARQHLVVTRSIRTAQALYIAADDVLNQVDDPAIFSVREILAGELAAIRSVTEVDISSLYLQLGAIAGQVNSLQVSNDLATQIAAGDPVSLDAQAQEEEAGIIRRFFSSIRRTLNNYLVVRRRDVPIQPLMTPGQETALMQTIRLQIEQGRTALLKGEQEIYTTSLEQARNNIATFLAGDAGIRNSILTTLDSLRTRRIVTEVPPLNRTLSALEQILSTRDTGTSESAGN
jgi:uroporphyrin-3 C-methyltransferase